jgi:MFS transporter, FHS family, glucose/mannose:H+ symporter
MWMSVMAMPLVYGAEFCLPRDKTQAPLTVPSRRMTPWQPKPEVILRAQIQAHAGLLFAGVLTFALMGAGQSLYGPALPAFARAFGLDVAQAGWLISALWIGSAIGVALMFFHGQGATPRHALGAMAIGSGIVAAGPGWWGTLAGSVVFGVGYGVATVVFNPRVLRAFGTGGPAMVSLLNACFAVGAILMPLIFVALGSQPRMAFGGISALCALIWLAAGSDGADSTATAATQSQPFRLRPLILSFGVVCIGIEASLIGLGPTALIRAGMTEVEAAQLLSAFFVAFLLSRSAMVFVAHLFSAFTIYTAAMSVAALAAIAAVLLPPGPFFVVIGACAGLFFPGFYVTAAQSMGNDPRVTPTIIASGLLGGITSPVIIGSLVGGMGERGFFWIIAGVMLITSLAALALRPRLISRQIARSEPHQPDIAA